MPDMSLIRERLEQVQEALLRIEKRFSSIRSHQDFLADDGNMEKLDAIICCSSPPVKIRNRF